MLRDYLQQTDTDDTLAKQEICSVKQQRLQLAENEVRFMVACCCCCCFCCCCCYCFSSLQKSHKSISYGWFGRHSHPRDRETRQITQMEHQFSLTSTTLFLFQKGSFYFVGVPAIFEMNPGLHISAMEVFIHLYSIISCIQIPCIV